MIRKCFVKKKKKKDNRLKGTTLSPKKETVLTKCCNNTKTKSLLMVFLKETRKVKLNKQAFLTQIGLSYLPNLFSLCLDIHNHWILKEFFSLCKNPNKVTQIFLKLFYYVESCHWVKLKEFNIKSYKTTLTCFFNENQPKQVFKKKSHCYNSLKKIQRTNRELCQTLYPQ